MTWNTGTGQTNDNGVTLDGGFDELSFQLTASKRQDPLVWVGNLFYQKAFESNHVEPGDQVGYSLSTFLAISPETSMRFGFSQNFVADSSVRGDRVKGSNFSSASFNLGVSVLLGARTLLDVSGSIGANDEAPDYGLRVSLPIQFDLPLHPFGLGLDG